MRLCKYRNALGEPKKGAHSIRVFNVAVIDLLLTILAAAILHWVFKIPIIISIISMLLLGIIMHRLFCVRTTVDKIIFR
jgi:hypothetical protein